MGERYCVILAGGSGSRFWPLSKRSKPKQFLDILSNGSSMIRATYERFQRVIPSENFFVVTNEAYRDLVKEHIPELSDSQILCESVKRNTAPAIAYAIHKIHAIDPTGVMVVTPSDHYISDVPQFCEVIENCLSVAQSERVLTTIGIRPDRPEVGYGYIQRGSKIYDDIYKVKTFTEKPDIEMAKVFLDSGEFLWNSGIFVWSTISILAAFAKHAPDIHHIFSEGVGKYNTPEEQQFVNSAFFECENISVDYAVMEKASGVFVQVGDFGWADIGTWGSLYEFSDKDDAGNATIGSNINLIGCSNMIVKTLSDKHLVVDGLDGYIVVDGEDGVLVCPKSREQSIRNYISKVNI